MKHNRNSVKQKLIGRVRKVYFFGYGADASPELIQAITGHAPKVIGEAILDNYKLCIQDLNEVTNEGSNPRKILAHAWNDDFKSYVILPEKGAQVKGTLYKIRLNDRHDIDAWEMVDLGWYDKLFIEVTTVKNKVTYHAETQVLSPGQPAQNEVDGLHYSYWLIDKTALLTKAHSLRRQFNW